MREVPDYPRHDLGDIVTRNYIEYRITSSVFYRPQDGQLLAMHYAIRIDDDTRKRHAVLA